MSCPGSPSYNIHGDGRVEVNGTSPTFSSASVRLRIQEAWGKYGSAVSRAASHYNIPAAWVFAILMQESNGGKQDCSPCSACDPKYCSTHLGRTCCAFSIMQFLPSTAAAQGFNIEDMMRDEPLAITAGAQLLSRLLAQYNGDIVKAATSYNAGGLRCGYNTTFGYQTNGDYAMDVVRWANTAITMKLAGSSNGNLVAFILAAAGVAAAGAIYTGRWEPRWAQGKS